MAGVDFGKRLCLQATWLINLVGVELPMPKEFDDPNATCANILSSCRKLGFASPAYHPSKLTVRCAAVVYEGGVC